MPLTKNQIHFLNEGGKRTRANFRRYLNARKGQVISVDVLIGWLNEMPKRQNKRTGGLGRK